MTIQRAKEILKIEAQAIVNLINRLDKNFDNAVNLIYKSKGRIVVIGIGKAGIIGQKLSATLSSTGTPSLSVHPADALHGDLGRITKKDVVIALSTSGETEEIIRLLPTMRKIGAKLISLTGNCQSTLARFSNVVLDVSVRKEACPLGLAPSASTTAMLAMCDALALVVLDKKKFKAEDFAFYHPGGNLGKRLLLKVEDIMRTGRANPIVRDNALVRDVLISITSARAGGATVVDKKGRLIGIFTDGDLRRHLDDTVHLTVQRISSVMTKRPKVIKKGSLAVEALKILKGYRIDEIPVVDARNRPIGLLDIQDLLKVGLV